MHVVYFVSVKTTACNKNDFLLKFDLVLTVVHGLCIYSHACKIYFLIVSEQIIQNVLRV